MLQPKSSGPDDDALAAADSDRATAMLGDGLDSSRILLARSRTLIALAECPGPALHDPVPTANDV